MKKFMAVFCLIMNLPFAAVMFHIWLGETEGDLTGWKRRDECEKAGMQSVGMAQGVSHGGNEWSRERDRRENRKESEREQRCCVKEASSGKIRIPLTEGERNEISSISLCGEWKGDGAEREWVTVVRIIRK